MTTMVTQDGTTPEGGASTRIRLLRPVTLALAWSLGMVGLALAWLFGLASTPFPEPAGISFGAVLTTLEPRLGSGISLGFGLVAAAVALAALRSRRWLAGRAAGVAAGAVATVIVMTILNGGLLALLGYLPVTLAMGWAVPGMWPAFLAALGEPEAFFQLYSLAGALIWAGAAVEQGRAVWDSGRYDPSGSSTMQHAQERSRIRMLRIGRAAVGMAVACLLVYPALRMPWLVGIPVGMDASAWEQMRSEPGMLATGVALGCAAIAGAVLMLGLVQRWGERFPRWMLGLAGRRVPLSLAVVPATVVAFAFVAQGSGVTLNALFTTSTAPVEGIDMWLHIIAFAALLPCGVALAVATGAYAIRRQGTGATSPQS